ncbi:extracellular solute-binding protein [Streptomyces indicus]|uniref:Raffinose/stachyose/melibiose transport system substrate-binding protein n=1 Tax=Streptomyces indicus TaxID=417292 RepID=A0A1G8US97_9ACTN|nr:extracellular solute-binding protein [Streptomyces indicus]SDJ56722.1 raffinose/stachyose/melibiose transport system substrate-binding protein [Streptomyces indicus]
MPHAVRSSFSRRRFLGVVSVAGLGTAVLTSCGDSDDGGSTDSQGRTVVEWWHIRTTEPGKTLWPQQAKAYEKAHPDTRIKLVPLENDAFKAKMTALVGTGKLPDMYNTWGGGVLKQQVDAGLTEDITDQVKDWIGDLVPASRVPYEFDGRIYAVPEEIGAVGFWYNKAHFKEAGIASPPATWAAFLDAVKKLKDAGITPIALAGKEKWPGMYYWAYLAIRIAGVDGMQKAADAKDFTGDEFVKAGEHLKELVDLDPFQKGFLGAAYPGPTGQGATMGNAKAAMELMGQWAPNVQSSEGKGLGDDLGFFPFPAVEGGKGKSTDVFGGGGGYALRKGAPKEALEFLKWFVGPENNRVIVKDGGMIPVNTKALDALTDPNLKAVSDLLNSTTAFQLYLDQAYPPAVGQEVNDSVAALIAGSKSPADVARSITQVAKSQ